MESCGTQCPIVVIDLDFKTMLPGKTLVGFHVMTDSVQHRNKFSDFDVKHI